MSSDAWPVGHHPDRRGRGRRRAGASLALAVVAVVVTACVPVVHPTFRAVAPYLGPVGFQLLSSDGTTAVVRASGPSAVAPGAGNWLVDRASGAATALPAGRPVAISDDGQRVAVQDDVAFDSPITLWRAGAVVAVPSGMQLSADLRWGAGYDANLQEVVRWDTATGAIARVEVGHPRPAEAPDLAWGSPDTSHGVADGGTTIWFELEGPSTCLTRFIDLSRGTVRDVAENLCLGPSTVAANGSAFVRELDPLILDGVDPSGGPRRLELVSTATGGVLASVAVQSTHGIFNGVVIAESGWNLWAVELDLTGPPAPGCGGRFTPPCVPTLRSATVVSSSPVGTSRFPVDGLVGEFVRPNDRMATDAGGRFLAIASGGTTGSVHLLDRVNATDEVLVGGGGGVKAPPVVSDGGRVVAFAEHQPVYDQPSEWTGWYEHLAD